VTFPLKEEGGNNKEIIIGGRREGYTVGSRKYAGNLCRMEKAEDKKLKEREKARERSLKKAEGGRRRRGGHENVNLKSLEEEEEIYIEVDKLLGGRTNA
jgi:hypothetical protein